MKPTFLKSLLGALGFALAASTSAFAAPWGPPQLGDLILGFQAEGGTGSGTNVLYNLGPAYQLRDSPNPGTIVDLSAQLEAAFGADWFTRTDVWFGAFTIKSNQTTGSQNGDQNPTAYFTKASATNAAGTADLWTFETTSNGSILTTAWTPFNGMINALSSVTADSDGVGVLTSTIGASSNPAWNNSWTKRNPFLSGTTGIQTAAFSVFANGIQNNFGKGGTTPVRVDIQRLQRGEEFATYIATINVTNLGVVSVTNAAPPVALTTSVVGQGSITRSPNASSYSVGTVVQLTAVPVAGYAFTGWSGALTGATNPQSVTMSVARSVTATFAPDLADSDSDGISNFTEVVTLGTNPNVANTVPALPLGFTSKGQISLGGAEISAFYPGNNNKRLFVTEPTTSAPDPVRTGGLAVVNLNDPAAPVLETTLRFTAAPFSLSSTDVNSVACANGVVAVAVSTGKTTSGKIVFLNASDLSLISIQDCGVLPDMVTFTPNGTKLLVANEGEYLDSNGGAGTGAGTVTIIDGTSGFASPSVTSVGFTGFDSQVATLKSNGVRIFGSELPSLDLEPEYIAVSPDGAKAMVTLQENNAVAILDIASATFTSIVPLGKKDFSTLLADFSDKDSSTGGTAAYLRTGNPVKALYLPDGVASFTQGAKTYYITANEGDDRNDFLNPDEKVRLSTVTLDGTTFPSSATLQQNANLGRLNVTNVGANGDAQPNTEILAYGGRSFSILNSSGAVVYDSGDLIEKTIASYGKGTDGDAPIFDDTRSDDKGPEPEGVTVAQLGAKTLAFVGLERSNGILVFDITNVISNPSSVSVVAFLRKTGDISPEGILTIPAADSPNGKMLAVSSNEVSNTVSIFEMQQVYTLTVNNPSNGSVTGNNGSYVAGSEASLHPIPASGYAFTGWTVNGSPSGTADPLKITMEGNTTVSATFAPLYQLTLTQTTGGTISAVGGLQSSYVSGTSVSLVATPAAGYVFSSWSDGVSSNSITMDADKTVSATFSPNTNPGLSVFSIFQEAMLASLKNRWEVGDDVDLDLSFFYNNIPGGYSIAVAGLPLNLKFDAGTKKITGKITAEMPDLPLQIQLLDTKKKVSGTPLVWDFEVAPYRLLGSYEVLVENAGLPFGKAAITVTGPGAYTATLTLQGQKERKVAKGVFPALTGNAPYTVTVPFLAGSPTSGVNANSVAFLIDPASDLVTGSVGVTPSTTGVGTTRGFRLAKSGREPRFPVTVALENATPGNRTGVPGGQGYATGSLKSGQLTLSGALGDAQAWTAGLNLSQTEQAVIFVQPYTGTGTAHATSFFGGIITVGDVGQPRRGSSLNTPLDDGLTWRKAGVSADKSYKLGIGPLSVNARVDRWLDLSKSAGGLAAGLGLTNRQVYTDYEVANKPAAPGGQALPTVFSLRNKFGLVRIAPANSVGSAGSVAPLTGAFSGSMTLSGFGAKTTINGVLLQDDEGTAVGVGLIKIPTSATDFETASIRFLNSVAP